MPSTTIHARINAFEALARPSVAANHILETPLSPIAAAALQPTRPPSPSPSPSPPNLGRKTSLIDLKDWVVDDGPATNGHSRIDVSKTPTQQGFAASATAALPTGPLINFGSPPKLKPMAKPANLSSTLKAPPQLPPRKPSYTSLRSFSSSTSSQPARKPADSLTVEAAHRYPPLTLDPERARNGNGSQSHVSSSSVSSFHSVSLSEDTEPSTPGSVSNYIATFPMDAVQSSPPARLRTGDSDTTSLTESYENVSASSLTSPTSDRLISFDWERSTPQRKPPPPKLPERPNSSRVASIKSTPPPSHPVSRAASASGSGSIPNSPIIRPTVSAASSSSTFSSPYPPAPYVPRRSAPPPPSRSSDRASIQSTTTTHSQSSSSQQSHASWTNNTNQGLRSSPSLLSLKTKRPTPVPSAVRRRYEALFVANVIQRRRAEREKHRKLTEAASDDGKPALLSPGEVRGRRAVGWRGLSVDLITGDEVVGSSSSPSSPPSNKQNSDDAIDEVVGSDERLEGALVRLIWQRSGLDKERLVEIWNECDLTGQGALSLEAFVKGMWRIDEELRRAQVLAIRTATSGSGASRRTSQARHSTLSKLNFSSLDNLSPSSLHSPNQWPSPKGTQQRGVPPPPPPRPPQRTRDILR